MKRIVWEVEYLSVPSVIKYCKKCKGKREFICSGQFRINAQRKTLDIWLIYKCSNCNTTWNETIYSRIPPKSLKPELLEAFYKNDEALVVRFAEDTELLQKNGVNVKFPQYVISGNTFPPSESVELVIKSKYAFPIKVSDIVRKKLSLTRKEYEQLVADKRIVSIPDCDLLKSKLNNEVTLIFNKK